MRLTHLMLLLLAVTFSISSCDLLEDLDIEIDPVDRTEEFRKKLQKKEWNLTRAIVDGNDIEISVLKFNFISDTEVEVTKESFASGIVTETNNYLIESSHDSGIKFHVNIAPFILLSVVSITDDIMTTTNASSGSNFFEFQ